MKVKGSMPMEEMIDLHLNGNLNLFFSDWIKCNNYDIYYSDVIEDEYWNYAYLKSGDNLEGTIKEVSSKMKQINRKPAIYITSNIMNEKLEQEIKNMNLELLYIDCWMFLENLKDFKKYKSSMDFSIYKVDENLQTIFIKAVMNGFSGDNPDDPYDSLSDCYRVAMERSFQKNRKHDVKIFNYLAMKNEDPIGTATILCNESNAVIYNITTLKEYKKKGVCKQLMSHIINELSELNIKEVCLQTEKGYYPEEIYKKMGFKEKLLGKVYLFSNEK